MFLILLPYKEEGTNFKWTFKVVESQDEVSDILSVGVDEILCAQRDANNNQQGKSYIRGNLLTTLSNTDYMILYNDYLKHLQKQLAIGQ